MTIETHTDLVDFFREKIMKVQEEQSLELNAFTQFYLTNLLGKALHTQIVFRAKGQEEMDVPLAILFGKALEAQSAQEQLDLMRFIGDRSLYVSGFFADSLARKSVDVDYYIGMGGNAYAYASSLSKESNRLQNHSDVFCELAQKFHKLVDLISEISENLGLTNNENILRLYERWLLTKSQRLRKKLQDQGIQPFEMDLKKVH